MKIIIPIPPITKKNSQILVTKPYPRVLPSQRYRDYERDSRPYMPRGIEPINEPVNVQMVFYMPTRRRVDLVNLQEACLDVLTKYGVIADDNCNVVATMDGSRVAYDKEKPRTEVLITKKGERKDD